MTCMFRSPRLLRVILIFLICALSLPACNLPQSVACSTPDLIEHLLQADATPALDTLSLTPGCHYELFHAFNPSQGYNGLPAIHSPIVIKGNGAFISRANVQDRFRLFYIDLGGDLTLRDLTLSGGYAFNPLDPGDLWTNSGGAIYNLGTLTITRTVIRGNNANNIGEGGGILNGGTLTMTSSTLEENEDGMNTIHGGAALYNAGNAAYATLISSTISRNGLLAEQDAIWTDGNLSMTNSTISGNGGDGINLDFGEAHLDYVTIAFNARAGMSGVSGHWYVTNSLLVSNGSGDCSPNLPLSIPQLSNIMDSDGSCGGLTAPAADIRLAPLGLYGGPNMTHALGAGSAALDRVDPLPDTSQSPTCIPTDQRSRQRPFGPGCDLGAFEYSGEQVTPAALLAPTDALPAFTATPPAPACTFTAAVDLNCRSGPGMLYPAVDFLKTGESASLAGRSPDGRFAYVLAPHNPGYCAIPVDPDFGRLAGAACASLPEFTPLPVPTATLTTAPSAGGLNSQAGCTIQTLKEASVHCVVPCPTGAWPGLPCNP